MYKSEFSSRAGKAEREKRGKSPPKKMAGKKRIEYAGSKTKNNNSSDSTDSRKSNSSKVRKLSLLFWVWVSDSGYSGGECASVNVLRWRILFA